MEKKKTTRKNQASDTVQAQLAAAAYRAFQLYGTDLSALFQAATERRARPVIQEQRLFQRVPSDVR